jgi:hypothetical protein
VIGFPISDQITWALASAGAFFAPSGDLLAQSAAVPFIVNFTQVEKDGCRCISKAEFDDACAKGLVKNVEDWLPIAPGSR